MITLHPNMYINALLIIIGFFLISRIFQFLSEKVILALARKTTTDIDDKIIEGTRGPLSLLLLTIGLHIGTRSLHLGTFTETIANLILTFEILLVTFIAMRIVIAIIREVGGRWAAKTESKADDQLIDFGVKITYIIGWCLGVLYALTVWGVQIGPLLASLGVLGIAVAFALQQSLGNIFGGVSMMLDRTVHVGDVVELDALTSGEVVEIGLRATKIRTFNNEILIIPNGILANGRIKNIVLPEPKVRVVVPFGVAYGTNIEKVKTLVLKEVKQVKGYLAEPEPIVRFLEMGASSLNFKAYFWVEQYSMRFAAIDEANTRIYNALGKAGIEIPFPQMDVHIKNRPASRKINKAQ